MLKHPDKPQLGIQKTPPELSMYRSMLDGGQFHTERAGQWQFGAPNEEWLPVWGEIHSFLDATQSGRLPITELYRRLKQPPYGMREGPLPLLICAVLLAAGGEIALYEEGVFVPQLRIELLERLTRNPDLFEIQKYAFSDGEQLLFQQMREALSDFSPIEEEDSPLLGIVRALVMSVIQLLPYARQARRFENPACARVRDVLLKSQRSLHAPF